MNGPVVVLAVMIAAAFVLWAIVELDAYLDRRAYRRAFPDEYRYQRARAAVARAQRTHYVRLGHTTERENHE